MRKERYEAPDMEVIEFASEDIVTISNLPGIDEGEGVISLLELWE